MHCTFPRLSIIMRAFLAHFVALLRECFYKCVNVRNYHTHELLSSELGLMCISYTSMSVHM